MKSVPKLIRRFVGLLLLSFVLVIILNVVIFAIIASNQLSNGHPWSTAEEMAAALQTTESGYALPDAAVKELQSNGAWAILIDNSTHDVVWHSDSLPDSIPMSYTLSDIASLTRGYIDGYPTFTSGTEQGLKVLGYPKTQNPLMAAHVAELGLSAHRSRTADCTHCFNCKYRPFASDLCNREFESASLREADHKWDCGAAHRRTRI